MPCLVCSVRVQKRYAFLFRGFNEATFFWDSVVSLRKLVLSAIAAMIPTASRHMRLAALISAFAVALLLHVRFAPYRSPQLNLLEGCSLLLALLTLVFGIPFLDADAPSGLKTGLAAVLFSAHVAFVLALLAAISLHLFRACRRHRIADKFVVLVRSGRSGLTSGLSSARRWCPCCASCCRDSGSASGSSLGLGSSSLNLSLPPGEDSDQSRALVVFRGGAAGDGKRTELRTPLLASP